MKNLTRILAVVVMLVMVFPATVNAGSPRSIALGCPKAAGSSKEAKVLKDLLHPCVKGDYSYGLTPAEKAAMIKECTASVKEEGKPYLKEIQAAIKELKKNRPLDDYDKELLKEYNDTLKLVKKAVRNPKKYCTDLIEREYGTVPPPPSSNTQTKDAKRLSDVRQYASALELFYNDYGQYPDTLNLLVPNYLSTLLKAPTPAGKGCSKQENTYTYTKYSYNSYELTFCLGKSTSGLSKGNHTMSEWGIQ